MFSDGDSFESAYSDFGVWSMAWLKLGKGLVASARILVVRCLEGVVVRIGFRVHPIEFFAIESLSRPIGSESFGPLPELVGLPLWRGVCYYKIHQNTL